jgi:hypothetical protein
MLSITFTLGSLSLADSITLNNGDHLTGEIQKVESDRVTLKTAYAGLISIDRKMIAKLNRAEPASAQPPAHPTPTSQQTAAAPAKPKTPEATDDDSDQGLSINADIEHIYAGRNKATDLSSNLDAQNIGDKHEVFLNVHQTFSQESDSSSHNNSQSGRLTYHYYLAEHPFVFSWMAFGHTISSTEAAGIAHQYGGGGGWSFVRSSTSRVWAQAGVLYGFTNGTAIQPAAAGTEGGEAGQVQVPYDLKGSVFLGGLVGKTKLHDDIKLSGQLYYFKPLNGVGHQQLGTDNAIEIR